MSKEEIENAVKVLDGKANREVLITLNFRKQYVKSKEGLIQTETLEIQMAPEIKESVNAAIFKAAKNGQLQGKYFAYGLSQTVGNEENRKILMRHYAFLASTQIVGIQGLTEAALDSTISYRDGNDMEIETKARDLLTKNQGILALEKTNLSEERGKYVLVCEISGGEMKEFIDFACKYFNEGIENK